MYPYNANSGSWTLSVSQENPTNQTPPDSGAGTSEPRYFKLSLPWESDVEVHLPDMTIDFDCKVNDSRCTNHGGTRDDSWSGTLPEGNHEIVVYPYRSGSGSYTLSLKVNPTLGSSYYGTVTETKTLVDTSETGVSSERSYPFTLEHGAEVSVELTGLTIDFDCKVNGSRCTNRGGTRDDSWTGTLAAGDHTVEVYPWEPGSGDYSLTVTSTSTLHYVADPMGAGPGAIVCDKEGDEVDEDSCVTIPPGEVVDVIDDDPGRPRDPGPPPGTGPGEGDPGPGPAPDPGDGGGPPPGGGGGPPSWPEAMMPQELRDAVDEALTKSETCSVETGRLGRVSAWADLTAVTQAEQIVPGQSLPRCTARPGGPPIAASVDAIPGTTIYICPAFFNRSESDMSLTIMHEGLHLAGVQHTDFPGTDGPGDPGPMNAAIRSACGYPQPQ